MMLLLNANDLFAHVYDTQDELTIWNSGGFGIAQFSWILITFEGFSISRIICLTGV